MKKIIALLCCLMLAVCLTSAYGSEFPRIPFPNPDNQSESFPPENAPENGIRIALNGQTHLLDFDPSEEFSNIANGMVQASFYTYGTDSQYLYEMFMVFPQNITAGTTIDQAYAIQNNLVDCSVVFMSTTAAKEQYFFSGQMNGAAYPQNTSYAIRFDNIQRDVNGWTYTGSLTAFLAEIDLVSGNIVDTMQFTNAPFSFTMPVSGAGGQENPQPPMPGLSPTPTPAPKLDFRKV